MVRYDFDQRRTTDRDRHCIRAVPFFPVARGVVPVSLLPGRPRSWN